MSYSNVWIGKLEEIERDLHCVHEIIRLEQEGYKIYAALDFAEVYTYAFPLTAAIERWQRDLKRKLSEMARLQISLSYLIAGERDILESDLILLPPYLMELAEKVEAIVTGLKQLAKATRLYTDLLKKTIELLGGENNIKQELKIYKQTGEMSDALIEKLFEVGQHYNDVIPLISFLSGDSKQGVVRIARLLDSGPLRDLKSIWPDVNIDRKAALRYSKQWIDRIDKERNDPKRYYATVLDGQALSFLFYLNQVLIEEGRKELVILITHSQSMLRATKGCTVRQVLKEPDSLLPLVLSPQWAIVYLAHHCALKEETRRLLEKSKEKIAQINYLKKRIEDLRVDSSNRDIITQIEVSQQQINRIERELSDKLQRAEQLSIAAESAKFLKALEKPGEERYHRSAKLIEEFLNIFSHEKPAELLEKKAAEYLDDIPDYLSTILSTLSLPSLTLESLEKATKLITAKMFKDRLVPALTKVVISGKAKEFPYTLQFRNKKTRKTALQILKDLKNGNAISAYNRLVRALDPSTIVSEDYLLIAYFFALLGEYKAAEDEIKRGVELEIGPIHELYFLWAIIHSMKGHYIEAIRKCDKAIELKLKWQKEVIKIVKLRKDPRYLNEKAYSEFQLSLETTEKEEKISLMQRALADMYEARKCIENDQALQLRVNNNIAYINIELFRITKNINFLKASLAAREKVLALYRKNRDLEWYPEYTDTLLWIKFHELGAYNKQNPALIAAIAHSFRQLLKGPLSEQCLKEEFKRHLALRKVIKYHLKVVEQEGGNLSYIR